MAAMNSSLKLNREAKASKRKIKQKAKFKSLLQKADRLGGPKLNAVEMEKLKAEIRQSAKKQKIRLWVGTALICSAIVGILFWLIP